MVLYVDVKAKHLTGTEGGLESASPLIFVCFH